MRLFHDANYNFIGNRKIAYAISAIIMLIFIGGIVVRGLQYGIDFKGGKEFVIEFNTAVSVTDVRSTLTSPLGAQPEVKRYGNDNTVLIRTNTEGELNDIQTRMMDALDKAINPVVIKSDNVGPRFAEDLKRDALYAIIASMIVIFLYILIRFKYWTFSVGAVVALAHDVIFVLGLCTLGAGFLPFSLEIDQNLIAAFLTIVGYSLNDTVVIFDRIRENRLTSKTEDFAITVNRSINQTLSRTIITTGTTLFVVVVLFIFGGEVLKGLSFALIIGMIAGTYSTIFIASSILVDLDKKKPVTKKAVA